MANTKPQSYLDYFQSKCKTSPDAVEADKRDRGTCNSMCPDEEVIVRESQHLVHVLEVIGNEKKLVKRYARPAADTNLAIACNLRPFHVLKKTVNYLLFEVTKRTDVNDLVKYNFVTDRLRAVRQDMIIQDFDPNLRIILLEPMIRFHTYYGYLLCEESINDYSPTLNRNMLLECLKTCLYCYDELSRRNTGVTEDVSFLTNTMDQFSLEEKDRLPRPDRGLMEALYVLTNFYDESPMWRLGRLEKDIRQLGAVRAAYALAAAARRGRYVAATRALARLCPLAYCAAALQVPRLQRDALRVICVAYSCRGRCVPLQALRTWLALGGEAAAAATLRHYGLEAADGQVACQRGLFKEDAPLLPPRKVPPDHLQDKMNIAYILTYASRDLQPPS